MKNPFRRSKSVKKQGPIRYQIGNINITLPPGHRLPAYQSKHKNYDRFLPHLARYLHAGDVVIDVGANVGDTLASILDGNPHLQVLCIEADDEFFGYLQNNLLSIKNDIPEALVELVKALVGKTGSYAELSGEHGTKHAVMGNGGVPTKPLSEIVRQFPDLPAPRLIKSDVDGFDHDVISSAGDLLDKKPLLFFECHFQETDQMKDYLLLLKNLFERGYGYITVFDNFGAVVCSTDNIYTVEEMFKYVDRQNKEQETRTIYYYDVLVYAFEEKEWVKKILQEY
ncbi:FkbM family methyltransferase [Roseibium aggregatum]|uniref:FkbM family methyltransferase n=1 Tax=Roseibium aggregatum TaxID=187304 RepID=UPI0025AC60C1|nr:FkbM family methyltransferase [Roseibium aggregatum]WJS02765.1 FkbM family methyltransferase [Roseibium aggregatum]